MKKKKKSIEDMIREFREEDEKRYYLGKGYDSELDEIIDKQPKFNLTKINAKEVFGLLNSEDIKTRKKAVYLLYKAYRERYLKIGYKMAEVHYQIHSTPWHDSIEEDTFERLEAELPASCETAKYKQVMYIFLNLRKAQTKPNSEKEIGTWLDEFVNSKAGIFIEHEMQIVI
jgi:hypothetical protein